MEKHQESGLVWNLKEETTTQKKFNMEIYFTWHFEYVHLVFSF